MIRLCMRIFVLSVLITGLTFAIVGGCASSRPKEPLAVKGE